MLDVISVSVAVVQHSLGAEDSLMTAGGTVFSRRFSEILRSHGSLYLRRLHQREGP